MNQFGIQKRNFYWKAMGLILPGYPCMRSQTNRLKKNNLIGHCELDLFKFLTEDSDSTSEEVDLLDPSSSTTVVGKLCFSCSIEDPQDTEKDFARRILSIMIARQREIHTHLLLALKHKLWSLWWGQEQWHGRLCRFNSDYDEDGRLSFSEFPDLIDAFGNQVAVDKKEWLFKAADKDGDGVVSMDELAELLALHQEKELLINTCPVCSEVLDTSNWVGSMVHMTLCFNEGTGNNVMSGGFLTDKQASYGWLLKMSEWAHYSSYGIGLHTGSKAEHILVFDRITKRLVEELIGGKIILAMRTLYQTKLGLFLVSRGGNEILQNLSEKQGEKINSVDSVKDIPKFVESFKNQLNLSDIKYPMDHFKVNPIAVCNVFTENKRAVSIMSTAHLGKVAFVAIGATMVGGITFTRTEGEYVQKGDEFGYFSFGGSTVIFCVFEKGAIKVDDDLLDNSARSLETLVRMGMTLGLSTKTNV